MANIIRQTTELAMHVVRAYVKPGDVVADATCGNGKDTLALAQMNPARLYAFDVQEDAVRETIKLLEENGYGDRLADSGKGNPAGEGLTGCRITVRQMSHENLREFFETTIKAVQDAMELIRKDGLVCITMYSGHTEGKKEKAALLEFAGQLDSAKWHCAYISMPNQKNDPPEILLITRKG